MNDLILRCSALDDIMSAGRSKAGLSAKAKAVIEKMAIEHAFATPIDVSNKYIKKGIACENDSIELFNRVFFKNISKNTERLSNEYITGECDLIDGDCVIDIKTSWDVKTFASQHIDPTPYEWQLRGYMWLYDKQMACTVHCLVNTPENLCRYEESPHVFDHIDPFKRVIVGNIVKRDAAKEQEIIAKYKACQSYYAKLLQLFKQKSQLPPTQGANQ